MPSVKLPWQEQEAKITYLMEEGDRRAEKILKIQEIQEISCSRTDRNHAASILGGSLGASIIQDILTQFHGWLLFVTWEISFFPFYYFLFIQFADLIPKRIAMVYPERIALRTITSCCFLFFFKAGYQNYQCGCKLYFRIFHIDSARNETVTYDDILQLWMPERNPEYYRKKNIL
ncbi:Domain of uncharacterised function DUF21 [Fusobacterium necrophorum subsp. necrophorum]|nr:Domain of uncharacterised function DUF21 [Fusobacterium necrophorum subsp. necrophorum]